MLTDRTTFFRVIILSFLLWTLPLWGNIGGFIMAQTRLPAIVLKDINGNEVRMDTIAAKGHPVIIDFFATWCKPCQRELAAIHEVYADWQDETGVELIAVSIDRAQDVPKVKPLVEGYGWEYRTLLDKDWQLKQALGVQMIPFVLILDAQGNIVYRHNGYTDGAEEELIQTIHTIEH